MTAAPPIFWVTFPFPIDPAVFIDVNDDDSPHLIYGGNRIWMTELDPDTGIQIDGNWWEENDPKYHFLAKGHSTPNFHLHHAFGIKNISYTIPAPLLTAH